MATSTSPVNVRMIIQSLPARVVQLASQPSPFRVLNMVLIVNKLYIILPIYTQIDTGPLPLTACSRIMLFIHAQFIMIVTTMSRLTPKTSMYNILPLGQNLIS